MARFCGAAVAAGLALAFPELGTAATYYGVAASAGVVGTIDSRSDDTPGRSVRAEGPGSSASAGPNVELRATTKGLGVLTAPSTADAGFFSGYRLIGSGDGPVPLNFDFELRGAMAVNAPGRSSGVSAFRYGISTLGKQLNGGGTLSCSINRCLPLQFGPGLSTAAKITITPKVTIEGTFEELIPEDLPALPGGYKFETTFDEYAATTGVIQGALAQALGSVGIPRLGLPHGASAELALDVGVDYLSKVSLPAVVRSDGILLASLAATASTSPGASAKSDFGSTFELVSITTERSILSGLPGLSVLFDSGREIAVTPRGSGGSDPRPPAPVPGPAPLALLLGALVYLLAVRMRPLPVGRRFLLG